MRTVIAASITEVNYDETLQALRLRDGVGASRFARAFHGKLLQYQRLAGLPRLYGRALLSDGLLRVRIWETHGLPVR